MINPTRTNLLYLKDRIISVKGSIGILKARRQALIQEFMKTTLPLINARDEISEKYEKAIQDFFICLGRETENFTASIIPVSKKDLKINIKEESIWGLKYKSISAEHSFAKTLEEKKYDYRFTSIKVEQSADEFSQIIDLLIEMAVYEKKVKKLGDEILKITRRIRILEEKLIPKILGEIKFISQYFNERERESFFRLKMLKKSRK
ncbi:MAG: V-type ATP synthase subunit D [Spirochaetia bacterium]|nr:V-type ATP synthase subunit D [Spirochaetia bacterium]